jgi:hypothetical protein
MILFYFFLKKKKKKQINKRKNIALFKSQRHKIQGVVVEENFQIKGKMLLDKKKQKHIIL